MWPHRRKYKDSPIHTHSDVSYCCIAYQCCLTNASTNTHTHTNTHTQTPATSTFGVQSSRRRQIQISRIVSELTGVASQTQHTTTHTHTNTVYFHGPEKTKARYYSCMRATSRRRQFPISRIASELTSVASQTQTQTHPHTHTHTHKHQPSLGEDNF